MRTVLAVVSRLPNYIASNYAYSFSNTFLSLIVKAFLHLLSRTCHRPIRSRVFTQTFLRRSTTIRVDWPVTPAGSSHVPGIGYSRVVIAPPQVCVTFHYHAAHSLNFQVFMTD